MHPNSKSAGDSLQTYLNRSVPITLGLTVSVEKLAIRVGFAVVCDEVGCGIFDFHFEGKS